MSSLTSKASQASLASQTMSDPQRVLRVIASLLDYPDAAWRARKGQFEEAIGRIEDADAARELRDFLQTMLAGDAQALEGRYVQAFDFGKKTSLNLTARSYEDERQQRVALLAYSTFYERAGYAPSADLPDYLPALLELAASVVPQEAARIMSWAKADMQQLVEALDDEGLEEYAALVRLALRAAESLPEQAADGDAANSDTAGGDAADDDAAPVSTDHREVVA